MPRYTKKIDRKIEFEEVQAMIDRAKYPAHKFVIALLHLTGARLAELSELKRRDFSVTGSLNAYQDRGRPLLDRDTG